MVDESEDPKTFFSKEMAGKGSLDDELLPNQGEPVPQEPAPEGGWTEGTGTRAEGGVRAGIPPLDDELLPNRGEPVRQDEGWSGGGISGGMGGGDAKSMEGADMAGMPPLDDEMLPNRGEPIPQNSAATSDIRDPLMKGDAGFGNLRAEVDRRHGEDPAIGRKAMSPYSLGPGDTGGGRTDLAGSRNKDQGDVGRDHLWQSGEIIKGRHHERGGPEDE